MAKYQSEGFEWIYLACAGTNMQKLVDLLETLFGEPEDIDPEQLETETTKTLPQQATEAEEAVLKAEHGPLPTDGVTHISITSVPIPMQFGIPEANLPECRISRHPQQRILQRK